MESTTIAFHAWKNQLLRLRHCRSLTWLGSIYDRLLNSRIGQMCLPFRRLVVTARLREWEKPFAVRLGTSDWMVLDEIFIRRQYGVVLPFLPQCNVILDLGSNVGYSLRFWAESFPAATIVGVEPDTGNCAICELNIRLSGRQIYLTQAFAGSESTWSAVDRSGAEWEFRRLGAGPNVVEQVRVKTVPEILDEFGLGPTIDLVKCDIEGGEEDLFSKNAEWLRNVSHLIIEIHGHYVLDRLLADVQKWDSGFSANVFASDASYSIVLLSR